MKKIIIPVILIALGVFILSVVWAKYNYLKNIETAIESKEEIIGWNKKDVLAKLGNPAAWGALDDQGGHRREVLLYTTWSKSIVIVLSDDKVVKVKLRDVRRPAISSVRSFGDFKAWLSSAARLAFGKPETVPVSVEQQ